MTKEYTTNVEKTREPFEELSSSSGKIVKASQIWKESSLIPEEAPTVAGKLISTTDSNGNLYKSGTVYTTQDGATINKLIAYYENLPLYRVQGTSNCYYNDNLKNIILEDFGSSYQPKIKIDGNSAAYGIGKPLFDVSAGTLYYNDEDFAKKILSKSITISFYRYVGKTGTFLGELPFSDDLTHFKNASDDAITATFKVRGEGHTDYILPPSDGNYYKLSDYSEGGEIVENTGVILLQENLEDTLWEQGAVISGGKWYKVKGVIEVVK